MLIRLQRNHPSISYIILIFVTKSRARHLSPQDAAVRDRISIANHVENVIATQMTLPLSVMNDRMRMLTLVEFQKIGWLREGSRY
jgi:hypothetical protein